MYKKILVPIDGSGKSLLAACHGAELASNFGASVTLIHVIPYCRWMSVVWLLISFALRPKSC